MEDIKKEIVKLLFDNADTVHSAGSCGELGDSFQALDADVFSDVAEKIYEGYVKKLQHHRDTTVGLYATDKEIGKLLYMFWQRASDACPLECGEAEKQEAEFTEWVKGISFRID